MGVSPESAPLVHAGGPLTVGLVESALETFEFWRAAERDIALAVGCAGRGTASFAYRYYDDVPDDRKPVVEVRFPAPGGGHLPAVRLELPKRC